MRVCAYVMVITVFICLRFFFPSPGLVFTSPGLVFTSPGLVFSIPGLVFSIPGLIVIKGSANMITRTQGQT